MALTGPALFVASQALAPSPAAADDSAAFELERLHLSADRMGLGSVEWGDTLPSGAWDLSLWSAYADDPLVVYAEDSDVRLGALVHRRLGGALTGAVGLGARYQVALELPLVLHQSRDVSQVNLGPSDLASLDGTGLAGVRVAPRIKAYPGLAAQLRVTLPIATSDYRAGKGLQLEPELLVSGHLGPLRAAANLGYRTRGAQVLLDQTIDDEFTVRGGLGLRLGLGEVAATLDAAISAMTPFANANQTAVEARAHYQLVLLDRWLVLAGAGLGIGEGFGTPDWRLFAGVRFMVSPPADGRAPDDDFDDAPGLWDQLGVATTRAPAPSRPPPPPRDGDHDGQPDDVDRCPAEPEDVDGFADGDGCVDLDDDGDNVPDATDACRRAPETRNGYQDADGCPDPDDRDGDAVRDDVDRCVDAAEDPDGTDDADGCPDLDDDVDGLPDLGDRCPRAAGPADNGGCPDLDGDGDTVVDRLDGCPAVAGVVAQGGCPAPQLVLLAADRLVLRETIYFRPGKAIIEKRSSKLLADIAAVLAAHPERPLVQVDGHTDDVGNDGKNLTLSQRRAEAVRAALIARGIDAERLRATGFGETRPVAPGKTKAARAKNRRVEFIFGERP